jgi:adenylosuccinate lyase
MENVALWHERDISHSAAERVIAPDTTIALDFALARLTQVMDKLVVYPKRMRANLERNGGIVFSGAVLLALTECGMSREVAYRVVQRNAMHAWDTDTSFRHWIEKDPQVKKALSKKALDRAFDPARHTRLVDTIFKRVFGDARGARRAKRKK